MVDYQTYNEFSNVPVTQADFQYIEARAVDILSLLCGQNWDAESAVCAKAVCYQIEHIAECGGLSSWNKGEGAVGSRSYSVGGESESVTFTQSKESEGSKTFLGLSISPFAWALLLNGGFLKTVKGVRVW